MSGEALGRSIGSLLFIPLAMLIIGGIYYFAARPRVTFRQAFFRWWVILASIVLWLFGVFGQFVNRF